MTQQENEQSTAIVLRDEKGRFLPGTSSPGVVIADRSQAVAMARRRWDLARQAAVEGMALAVKDLSPGNVTEFDAWREIVCRQARLAMDTAQGHASTRAAEFVGRAAGLQSEAGSPAGSEPGSQAAILPEAVYLRLLAAFAARLSGM